MRAGIRLTQAMLLGAALAASAASGGAERSAYDLWIRGGTVIDGTGGEPFTADVLIRGEAIAHVGTAPKDAVASRVIEAHGRLVTPGFIDTHAHGDPLAQSFDNFLAQGITTAVLGQDGGTADLPAEQAADLRGWMSRIDRRASEVNIATLTGHGTLRVLAEAGDSPVPTAAQLEAMKARLRDDLASGSYGLSFGLEYAPGRYSRLAEQKALGDLVGAHGGVVMSHMRSEDFDKIADALDELLAIDANVHVSHLKIVAGRRHEEAQAVLERLARARASGRRVTADVYPWLASASSLVFLYPDWAKRRSDYEKALATRRAELEAHLRKRVEERNGPEAILFTGGPHSGKTLADLARELGKPYEQVAIDDIGYGGPAQAHFLMADEVQAAFITADSVNICTDGAPGPGHPRSYDSFVKVLTEHVGPAPKMSFARAIHKMTALPASVLGLDRGLVAPGRKADLVVLSPERLRTRATWTEPMLSPAGLDFVIVNGAVALENGKVSAQRHGRMLRRPSGSQATAFSLQHE